MRPGLPESIAIQIAEIFSSQIDFHRDLRRGDRFAVVYESFHHGAELVRSGRVLAVEFINQGKTYQAVWFEAGGRPGRLLHPGRQEPAQGIPALAARVLAHLVGLLARALPSDPADVDGTSRHRLCGARPARACARRATAS